MKIPNEKKIDLCVQALDLTDRYSVYRSVDDIANIITPKTPCFYVPYLVAYEDGDYFAPCFRLISLTLKSTANTVDLSYCRFSSVDNIKVFFLCDKGNIYIIRDDIEEFCDED